MTNYSQRDPAWVNAQIANSPYTVGQVGCLLTAHCTALAFHGWNVTPAEFAAHHELFTDSNYPAGPGLLLWWKVSSIYPQYHFHLDDSGVFKFVQVIGTWTHSDGSVYRGEHWLLQVDGTYFDPFDGSMGMKSNYRPTGLVHSADIDLAPAEPVIVPVVATENPAPTTFWITVTARTLNVRQEPTTASPIAQQLHAGDRVECALATMGADPYGQGNNVWLKSHIHGLYLYSGGTDYHQPTTNV